MMQVDAYFLRQLVVGPTRSYSPADQKRRKNDTGSERFLLQSHNLDRMILVLLKLVPRG